TALPLRGDAPSRPRGCALPAYCSRTYTPDSVPTGAGTDIRIAGSGRSSWAVSPGGFQTSSHDKGAPLQRSIGGSALASTFDPPCFRPSQTGFLPDSPPPD